jgi:hypothetical protein
LITEESAGRAAANKKGENTGSTQVKQHPPVLATLIVSDAPALLATAVSQRDR